MKLPDVFAVVTALEAPLRVSVTPLPIDDGLTAPEMFQVDAAMFNREVVVTPPALADKVAV